MKSRLMLVADDPQSASALRRALRAVSAFDVMDGYVEGGASCATIVAADQPDIVVVDQLRSSDTTIARIGEVRAELPAAKIVLLPTSMDAAWLTSAADAGADAAIAKTLRLDCIGVLVREVAAGNVFHPFESRRALALPTAGSGLSELTDRELEILRRVVAGASNSRIAAQLWITEQTVKFHLSNVYRKLGVANRTQASSYALVRGLLEPEHSGPLSRAQAASRRRRAKATTTTPRRGN
jgi:DNA-binding NarL/FixJ family response regulator